MLKIASNNISSSRHIHNLSCSEINIVAKDDKNSSM